jgi:hypothetical protein
MKQSSSSASSDRLALSVASILVLATSVLGVCYTRGGTVNCCSRITAGGPVSDYGCGFLQDHACADTVTENPAVQRVQQVTRGKTDYTSDPGFLCKWRARGCAGQFGACNDASTTESTAGCTSDTPSGNSCGGTTGGGGPIVPDTPVTPRRTL